MNSARVLGRSRLGVVLVEVTRWDPRGEHVDRILAIRRQALVVYLVVPVHVVRALGLEYNKQVNIHACLLVSVSLLAESSEITIYQSPIDDPRVQLSTCAAFLRTS